MKTVACVICGNEVSKRKSLAYKDGRACRSHSEVEEMVEQKRVDWQNDQLEWRIRKIFLVSQIRLMHSMGHAMAGDLYRNLKPHIGDERLRELRQAIDEQGGPQMTSDEMSQVMLDAFFMKQVLKKAGE